MTSFKTENLGSTIDHLNPSPRYFPYVDCVMQENSPNIFRPVKIIISGKKYKLSFEIGNKID